jgi:hypothetical protein
MIQNGVEQAGESLNERIQVLEAAADNSISVIRAGGENLKGHIRDMNQQTEQAAGQVNAMRDTQRHQEDALTATADKVEVKTSEIE